MSDFKILLPYGLPRPEFARDLLRDLDLPGLSTLLARGTPLRENALHHDPLMRALPHEAWLKRHFGLSGTHDLQENPPIASLLMQARGLSPTTGYWLVVQPVHFHIARDHLVLTDARQVQLTQADEDVLFEIARVICAQAGLSLVKPAVPATQPECPYWFLQADQYRDLQTTTPDTAAGRNIDIWMPTGDSARSWRKLQNEIQMSWHAHPVNEKREQENLPVVNSLWIWGGSMHEDESKIKLPVATFNFHDWYAAFGVRAAQSSSNADVERVLNDATPQKLLLLDALIGPALAGDWSEWLTTLRALEQDWFAPLAAALANRQLSDIKLILSDGTRLQGWKSTSLSHYKFWVRPTLGRLLA